MSDGYPEREMREYIEACAMWEDNVRPSGQSAPAALRAYLAAVDAWRAKASTAPACGPFPCPRCGVLGCTERPVYVAYPATPIDPGTGKPYVSRCACQPYGTQYIVVDGKCSGCGEKLRPKPAEPQRTCEEILKSVITMANTKPPDGVGWYYCREQFVPEMAAAIDAHRAEVAALRAQVAERDKRIERALLILSDYQLAPNTCAGLALRILEGREP